jgi:hypothetical protein
VYTLSLSLVHMKVRDSDILAWVRGQRKMSQVLCAFGLLDFTMLWPILAWCVFWNLWTIYLFNFPVFFFSGRGKRRITETADTESADMGAQLYMLSVLFMVSDYITLFSWTAWPLFSEFFFNVCMCYIQGSYLQDM